MTNLVRFLIELAEDPLRTKEFRSQPNEALANVDLSDEAKQALLNRDARAIRTLLTDVPPERSLLLMTWFGSLVTDGQGS